MLVASVVLAVLFAQAAWHKLSRLQEFQGIVADYRILPTPFVKLAAVLLPFIELALALLWASQTWLPLAALVSAGLLWLYCGAIGVNLYRGRGHISCGCGLGSEQPLSVGIIARNLLLSALAAFGLGEMPTNGLVWFDYVVVALAALAIGAAMVTSSTLMANSMAMKMNMKMMMNRTVKLTDEGNVMEKS